MPIVKCKNPVCRKKFNARQADLNRGWGKFCSKSCKAYDQERRTGQNARRKYYEENASDIEHDHVMASCELGWDAHKDTY